MSISMDTTTDDGESASEDVKDPSTSNATLTVDEGEEGGKDFTHYGRFQCHREVQ